MFGAQAGQSEGTLSFGPLQRTAGPFHPDWGGAHVPGHAGRLSAGPFTEEELPQLVTATHTTATATGGSRMRRKDIAEGILYGSRGVLQTPFRHFNGALFGVPWTRSALLIQAASWFPSGATDDGPRQRLPA